jgi:nitronate monooxygenase
MEAADIPVPPYPLQNSLTAKLRKLAQQANDCEYTTLWAGQSARGKALAKSSQVIRQLINEFERLYK